MTIFAVSWVAFHPEILFTLLLGVGCVCVVWGDKAWDETGYILCAMSIYPLILWVNIVIQDRRFAAAQRDMDAQQSASSTASSRACWRRKFRSIEGLKDMLNCNVLNIIEFHISLIPLLYTKKRTYTRHKKRLKKKVVDDLESGSCGRGAKVGGSAEHGLVRLYRGAEDFRLHCK